MKPSIEKPEQGRTIFRLNASKLGYTGGIRYKTHVQSFGRERMEKGWSDVWNERKGKTSGSHSKLSLATGTISSYYDVYYRVHAQSYGRDGPGKERRDCRYSRTWKTIRSNPDLSGRKGQRCSKCIAGSFPMPRLIREHRPVDNSIIYVYSWNTELGERLEYFKDKYPQYADKVKFENLGLGGTSDEYKKEIEAAYQKGGQKVPSIVAMDEGVTKYFMSSDMFVNMDSIGITQKDYSNAFQYTIDHATVNGKLKGLSLAGNTGMFCLSYRYCTEGAWNF